MPKSEGRSNMPGNTTTYKPIHIATANPSALQPGTVKPTPSPTSVLKGVKRNSKKES